MIFHFQFIMKVKIESTKCEPWPLLSWLVSYFPPQVSTLLVTLIFSFMGSTVKPSQPVIIGTIITKQHILLLGVVLVAKTTLIIGLWIETGLRGVVSSKEGGKVNKKLAIIWSVKFKGHIHTFNFHFHDKLKVKYHVKEPSKLFLMILKLCLKHDHWQSYGSSNFNHCTKLTFSVTFLPISCDPI